jgi:hypothetical protein
VDTKNVLSTIGKAIVSAVIPQIGGSIASIWSDLEANQVERKIQRFEELISSLQQDFDSIKDRVNDEFVKSEDCLDIFEKMSKMVINERVEEKRKLYKNVYLHSMIAQNVDFDIVERDLRFIEQLNSLEIALLKIFDNPKKYNKSVGEPIKNPFLDEKGNWRSSYFIDYLLIEQLMILLPSTVKKEDVYESLYFLSQNRILVDGVQNKKLHTNGNPISILEDVLTDKGRRFVLNLQNI